MSGEFAPSLCGGRLTLSSERKSWLWTLFLASYFFLLGFPRLFTITATAPLLIGLAGIVAMHLYVFRMWRRATAGKEAVAGPRARGTAVAARPAPESGRRLLSPAGKSLCSLPLHCGTHGEIDNSPLRKTAQAARIRQ